MCIRDSAWGGPAHDAWLGLFDAPPWCLLDAVVAAAFGVEIALACGAVGVGGGVVKVAEHGLGVAAGGGAGRGAGADEVLELAAGGVVVLLSLIHISEPTRLGMISYAVFCLKKKKKD